MEENHSTKDLLKQIEQLKTEIESYKSIDADINKSIFFNILVEQAGDGFELLDEHGKIIEANSITCEQLGYTKEELLKKHIWEIDSDLTELDFYEKVAFIKDHNPFIFEATHKKKNGTLFPVEVSVSIIEIGNKTYTLSLSRDISERKKYEFNLIKERNKARQILETIESIIVAIDVNGNVSMINRKGCEVLGYSENEIIGKNWFKNFLLQPDGTEKLYLIFKQLISGSLAGIDYYENEIITKNGEIKTIAWHNSFLIDEEKISGTLSSGEDITEKIKLKNELQYNEHLLKEAQTVAKLGYYEFDILTGFWTSSDELNNIFGIDSDYQKDVNSWLGIIHPDYKEEMQAYLTQHVLTEGKFFDKSYKIIQKNTELTLWVHGLGSLIYDKDRKPIKMFGTIQDINDKMLILAELKLKNEEYLATNEELVQANEELIKAKDITEESERRIRTMFSSSNAGFVVINAKGKLIEWNKTFIDYFGYTDDEFKNYSSKDITYYEDVEESFNKLNKIKAGEITDFRIEKRFVKKDKSIFWADMFVSALKKKDVVVAFIGVVNDITYRKEFEEQLILAKNKAEESDRLKSAFLANVSHEIRTPMNGIMGFAQMLANPDVTFEKRKFYSEIITNNCNQLLSILNDILDVSKIETGQMKIYNEAVNINNVMLEMTSFFKPHATKSNISLFSKKEVPDEFAIVNTDLTKLRQIFTNLLSNAIKFTSRGVVEFGYSLKKYNIEFYVKDTGIGILSDLQDKIFDRFRQAETSFTKHYGGTGLGLSISKGYVELMGGKIWLESEINKGTTFFFSIPICETDKIYKYNSDFEENNERLITVLIAEDEEINFLFIEEILLPFKYKLLHAKNGQEAIEIFEKNKSINLILMDIKMPIKNGFEATEEIRIINSKVPVIAQTAYALSEDIEKLKKFGFNDILTKPMTEKGLLDIIKKYI
ncbi:MAG: hypothetical protein A2033_16415 [Bacteroidetes bacterium GWA2_31_9]|nr:MAG: hypothetical protein A2033_16415 [Bacteroidetes bacterium GWA2_31_9]